MFTRWGRNLATQVIQDEEAKAREAKKKDQDLQEEAQDFFNIDDLVNQIVEQNDEGFSDRWSQVQKESVVEPKEPENLFSRWSRSLSSAVYAQNPLKVKEEKGDAEEGKEDEIEKEGEKNADDNDVKEKQNDHEAVEADQEETKALNDEPQDRSEFFRKFSRSFSSSTMGSRMKTDDDGDGEEEVGFLGRVGRTISASTQGRRVRGQWSSSTQGSRIQDDETNLVGEDENDASVPKEIQTAADEAIKLVHQVEDQQEKVNEQIGESEEMQSDVDPAAEQIGEKVVESSDIEPTALQ
jgi:hypothetical protein